MHIAAADSGHPDNKLFVGMIPKNVSAGEVQSVFEPFGDIIEVHLLRDATTGMSKGCGFVKYHTKEAANAAITALNGVQTLPVCVCMDFLNLCFLARTLKRMMNFLSPNDRR